MSKSEIINTYLVDAIKFIYDPLGYKLNNFVAEAESQEYSACDFSLDTRRVKYRTAKTTPTKVGQFVTVWKRNADGITCPYDAEDGIDLFVIGVRKDELVGQFVFPNSALIHQDILSIHGKGGKRGFRVYPPWEKDLNKQAQKTQSWQKEFFLELKSVEEMDKDRVRHLYLSGII